MVATTGFQAGFETTQSQFSYAMEAVWGVLPVVPFKAIRYTSSTLAGTKQRDRPAEITIQAEVQQAVTTRVQAAGDISFALSYGTFDDFFASAINAEWPAEAQISGAAGDITITAVTGFLTSTTGSKFAALVENQYIRTKGFTNAANNAIWRIGTKVSDVSLILVGPGTPSIVTETPPGVAAKIKHSMIRNGSTPRTMQIQHKFSASVYFLYAGCYVSGMTIGGGVGQFMSGSFTILAKSETDPTTDSSAGAVTAAPTGAVMDPVGGFNGIRVGNSAIIGTVESFSITIANEGATMEYGLGDASAAGVVLGTLRVSGSMKLFFKDLTRYDDFKNEVSKRYGFVMSDSDGNSYVFSGHNVQLMNPVRDVPGPGQAVMVTYDLEFNPSGVVGVGTIQIDRLAA